MNFTNKSDKDKLLVATYTKKNVNKIINKKNKKKIINKINNLGK